MIWLPGVLSQGGDKVTWGKYEIAYNEVEGTESSFEPKYARTKRVATSYTIENGVFQLVNSTTKTAENIASGDYLVDVSTSNDSKTSGSTIYKVTNNSGRPVIQTREEYSRFTDNGSASRYGSSGFEITSAGYYKMSSELSSFRGDGSVTRYSIEPTFTTSGSNHASYSTIYEWKSTNGSVVITELSISQGTNVTISYVPYTALRVRGEYVSDVKGAEGVYPDNGIQGDYWYVKYSDTPITWERYAVSQTAVEGSSTRATGVYNKYLKVGTTYSIENGEFAVTTTKSLRIQTATSSITAPYTILADGALSLQSRSQTTGGTVRGPMLGKLTKIAGSSSSMYADFIPYTVGDVKGSYIDSVTSYNPYEFPDDGAQDGYWYVKIS